jgi:hypothetical protein
MADMQQKKIGDPNAPTGQPGAALGLGENDLWNKVLQTHAAQQFMQQVSGQQAVTGQAPVMGMLQFLSNIFGGQQQQQGAQGQQPQQPGQTQAPAQTQVQSAQQNTEQKAKEGQQQTAPKQAGGGNPVANFMNALGAILGGG